MLDILKKKQPNADSLKRTYQNDLRAIGRHADDKGYNLLSVLEVADGFILRAFIHADPTAVEAIEIPHTDLQGLILKNFTARGRAGDNSRSPLCPTGYEDFLRAIGYELEINQARAVSIQEMVGSFAVSYLQLQTTSDGGYIWEPRSITLGPDRVREMLDEAFRRRQKSGHR